MPKIENTKIYLGLCLIVMLSGCASGSKTDSSLERARSAYAEASGNPAIVANAQVPLYDAKQALDRAEAATDSDDIEYRSYLAERSAQTAVAKGEQKIAEGQIEQFSKERDTLLISRREMETTIARERTTQLEVELAELKASQIPAKETERGIVVTLGDVFFAYNKADVRPRGRGIIDKVAKFLYKNPERTVAIEGHTDSTGSDEYNLDLSQRRADAVRFLLVSSGIDSARIQAKGMGEHYPIASNDNDGGRQLNRRVEIIIESQAGTVQK
jgi:outer membrane protein OmpA-like peptidoglycan-associated protein